ncbi:MAG: hypothetical protein AAGC56_03665 [Pseudomonadota bacterium]
MSLVELIAALGVLSLIMLAFFQSTNGWLLLSTQVNAAADASVENALEARRFRTVIRGLTPGWPERDDETFAGDATSLSGLSRSPLEADGPRLGFVKLSLSTGATDGRTVLFYESARTAWPIATFAQPTAFAYLGADGVWRDRWPPRDPPDPGMLNDVEFMTVPALPEAVRVAAPDKVWIASVASTPDLPLRLQDAIGDER